MINDSSVRMLSDSELSGISGGMTYKEFNKGVNIGGTVTTIVSGVASIGLMTASFICESKGVNVRVCSLLKKLALSSITLMGLGCGSALLSKYNNKGE